MKKVKWVKVAECRKGSESNKIARLGSGMERIVAGWEKGRGKEKETGGGLVGERIKVAEWGWEIKDLER